MKLVIEFPESIECKLDRIIELLKKLLVKEAQTMATIEDVRVAVAADTDLDSSAITLLNQLHDLLEEAQNDPVALQQIIDDLGTSNTSLASAITENTPEAPPEEPLA